MASGPWFYFENVTISGTGSSEARWPVATDLHLKPPFPNPPDPPITADSWAWASIAEVGSDGRAQIGDATMWITDVVPQDDGSFTVRVLSYWINNISAMVKLIFWSQI
jgi:hypothetical protein